MNYADIILPLPLEGTFTYYVPTAWRQTIVPGMRVVVPVGKSKRYLGIVNRLHDNKPDFDCREIESLPDDHPLVLPQQLKLWQWMADYYLCPLGDIYKAAMPIPLRSMERMRIKKERWVCLAPNIQTEDDLHATLDAQRRAPMRRRLLETFIYLTMEERDENKAKEGQSEAQTIASRKNKLGEEAIEQIFGHSSDVSPADNTKGDPPSSGLNNLSVSAEVLLNETNATTTALNNMVKQGLFTIVERPIQDAPELPSPSALTPLSPLSSAQQTAYEDILRQHQEKQVVLLRGVTSSGKTEIYTHLIADTLRQGGQVLYLLPEIALTTQITTRLQRVFGNRLGVYHSRYSEQQRADIWRRQCSDSPYGIILGARSAVMLPFQNLQLIIIDEEHDANLHQSEPSPRYHARNVAIMMAYMRKVESEKNNAKNGAHIEPERSDATPFSSSPLVLLGSATPCAESYYNARKGKYGYVELLTRYHDLPLPQSVVVDTKDLRHRKMMTGLFSPALVSAMQHTLHAGRQIIVFRNRRGYAPVLECSDCGWTPHCTQCDVSLTLHRRTNSLTCHTCGAQYTIPDNCPQCKGKNLRVRGYGTEKVEEALTRLIPHTAILRMDLDNTRSRHAHQHLIQQFAQGQAQILVGTQMVTKGLDFDKVDIVAVVDADSMLNMPDFRATETAFAMMLQVSGRAGRKEGQGQVFLQTRDANDDIIHQVVANDYRGFMHNLLTERKTFRYPPFVHLIYIYIRHRDEAVAENAATYAADILRQHTPCQVLGPDKPSVGRIRQEHIRKIVVKHEQGITHGALRQALRQMRDTVLADTRFRAVYLYFEVDP